MEILTLDQVCVLFLKITVETGRNRLSRGLPMPPSFRVGRRRLFVASEVDKWLAARAAAEVLPPDVYQARPVRKGRPRSRRDGSLV
jgi:predicted DNA-binding transcriptional regulator AlpA